MQLYSFTALQQHLSRSTALSLQQQVYRRSQLYSCTAPTVVQALVSSSALQWIQHYSSRNQKSTAPQELLQIFIVQLYSSYVLVQALLHLQLSNSTAPDLLSTARKLYSSTILHSLSTKLYTALHLHSCSSRQLYSPTQLYSSTHLYTALW